MDREHASAVFREISFWEISNRNMLKLKLETSVESSKVVSNERVLDPTSTSVFNKPIILSAIIIIFVACFIAYVLKIASRHTNTPMR